jgi:hypothetical protein
VNLTTYLQLVCQGQENADLYIHPHPHTHLFITYYIIYIIYNTYILLKHTDSFICHATKRPVSKASPGWETLVKMQETTLITTAASGKWL